MKIIKVLSFLIVMCLIFSCVGCAVPDKNYGITESTAEDSLPEKSIKEDSSKITSLDNEMSRYFDITLFDEENYSDIFIGKNFKLSAKYCNTDFVLPTDIITINKQGWKLVNGSDYDKNSLIYAKETAEVNFTDDSGHIITALFYNELNTSVRFSECPIVKLSLKNNYLNSPEEYAAFNFNGITNTSVVTDIFQILGTPSHFYKKSNNSYYFDYFYEESDRRNKIRIYVNLNYDTITEIEFSNYK